MTSQYLLSAFILLSCTLFSLSATILHLHLSLKFKFVRSIHYNLQNLGNDKLIIYSRRSNNTSNVIHCIIEQKFSNCIHKNIQYKLPKILKENLNASTSEVIQLDISSCNT